MVISATKWKGSYYHFLKVWWNQYYYLLWHYWKWIQHPKSYNCIINKDTDTIYNINREEIKLPKTNIKLGKLRQNTQKLKVMRYYLSDEKLTLNDIHQEKGASIWLLTLPLKDKGYCLNKKEFQVLRRFKSCSRCVGDSRWWGSLTMVPTGIGQPYHKNNSSSSSSSSSSTVRSLEKKVALWPQNTTISEM